ncbi:Uncharacterised protein [Mycobacteroides abscessus subsp. massiliense]|nr:Uncharacterised protein [Mycobacteroides abscessus subsp. massiliense]
MSVVDVLADQRVVGNAGMRLRECLEHSRLIRGDVAEAA